MKQYNCSICNRQTRKARPVIDRILCAGCHIDYNKALIHNWELGKETFIWKGINIKFKKRNNKSFNQVKMDM